MERLFKIDCLKKSFYFLCFFIFCICDQRIGSASGEIQLVCPNVVLIVLCCISLSHYSLSSFRRLSFLILSIVCALGAALVLYFGWPGTYYHYQLLSGVIAAVLYCFVLMQTFFALFSQRRLPHGNRLSLGILSVLLVLMLLSKHDRYIGALLCLSVVLIYLTDFTEQECEWMLKALGGAVLAAFFVLQGLAFVFRPYDTLRYLGMYANTNMNALLYQMAYCVFLGNFCILEVKKGNPLLKWGSFCFACAMWSFVLLTMCRSAILGMAAATLLGGGITLWKQRGKRLQKGLVYVCGMVLVSVLSFPIVYGAVRYLPPVFHHPIWFMMEYSEEKVHSWDAYDSEKYTDWRDVLQENFGRIFTDFTISKPSARVDSQFPPLLTAMQFFPASAAGEVSMPPEPTPSPENSTPAGTRSVSARLTIYQQYLSRLNLWGHADSENGVQVTESYFAPHAHNVILQYAFNYGLPAGLVFLTYLAVSGIRLLFACIHDKANTSPLVALLLFASITVFGMTELIWRYGQLSHTLLFLLPCFARRHRK